jgi:hypothetical protein
MNPQKYTEAGKAIGFALEQTLHVVALAVFSYVDFKVASAYLFFVTINNVLYFP